MYLHIDIYVINYYLYIMNNHIQLYQIYNSFMYYIIVL